jgi:hypothetical protein
MGWWRYAQRKRKRKAAHDWQENDWATNFIAAIADESLREPQAAGVAISQIPSAAQASSSLASLVPLPDDIDRSALGLSMTRAARMTMTLEAKQMAATLLNATLSYRLILFNAGQTVVERVTISGNMIAAHASLSAAQQLATDDQMLDRIDEIASLAPGESITLEGELRLPVAGITPIHSGTARLFVPVARFRVQGENTQARAAFVVGKSQPFPKATLLPFRLDLGPRIWPRLGARQINLPQDQASPNA